MSSYSQNKIASFCADPKNPFEVVAELKVRKMLEKHTKWNFEFSRNEFLFGVDIIAYKYTIIGNTYERNKVGKIEVEASPQWINNQYPPRWRYYSYLRRKVERWDKHRKNTYKDGIWSGEPVDEAESTIYLKCAIDMSDCHSALISDIWGNCRLFRDKDRSLREDAAWYFRSLIEFDEITKRGWKESIDFAINHFNHIESDAF